MSQTFSAELIAIEKAIAAGTTRVSYDGKSVEYDSFEKLLARRRWILAQQNGGVAVNPTSAVASFDRGDC